MISLMIDILMLSQTKDELLEYIFIIDKICFASASLNNIELRLAFGSASKKDPLCKVINFAKFEPKLAKNVLSP